MALNPLGGQILVKNLKRPQFYTQNGHETPPPKRWGLYMFQCFFSFLVFAFFCHSFSSLPLLLDIFRPKNGPQWLGLEAYIYIYIYRVKKLVQDLGVYKLKTGPSYKLKAGPSFFVLFFPNFIVFWGIFRNTNSATMCQNGVFAKFWGCQKWGFWKENWIFCSSFFYVGDIETEKKMERAKSPIKIDFLRWSSQNVKSRKNGFLANITWHYLCQEGRKTRIFVHTICFGQKFFWDQNSVNQETLWK